MTGMKRPPCDRTVTEIPTIGTVLIERGQHYRVEGYEPHTRRDGTATMLARLSSVCAECGQPFVTRTPARPNGMSDFSRRCAEHAQPGVPT
jgi:hypothetical protein